MYDDLVAEGVIDHPNWDDFDFTKPTLPGQPSREEMVQCLYEGYFKAYCRPGYVLSFLADRSRNINRVRSRILRVFWRGIRAAGANAIRRKLGLSTEKVAGSEAKKKWTGPTDVEDE
jgi:hypothetical protein